MDVPGHDGAFLREVDAARAEPEPRSLPRWLHSLAWPPLRGLDRLIPTSEPPTAIDAQFVVCASVDEDPVFEAWSVEFTMERECPMCGSSLRERRVAIRVSGTRETLSLALWHLECVVPPPDWVIETRTIAQAMGWADGLPD